MKILLINPPMRKPLRAEIPLTIDKEIGSFPSLGLLYVASFLKENLPEQEIEIIDAKVDNLKFEDLAKIIVAKSPDIVGITTLTFSLLDALDTAKLIKGVNPKIKICLGGPHVSIFARESLSLKEVDFVIMGEGEEAFLKLVKNLCLNKNPQFIADIAGLGFKDEQGNIFINDTKQIIRDLDTLPIPNRRFINYRKCYSLLGVSKFMASVQTTRGCPFRCIYCDQQSGKILRKRSINNIIKEIKALYELGIRDIFFVDDLFTLDRNRVFDFCDRLISEKIDIFFKISGRVDTVERKMLKRLKQAGCYRIHYGVESGTQKVLKRLEKGITLTQVQDAFTWAREAGIDIFAYFMIGCPGETRQEIMDTINFALKLKPDYAHFSICTPYPDTKLYKLALEEGVIKEDYWREFALNPDENFKTKFWTKELKTEELVALQNYANRKFYLRLPFLLKEIYKTRSWVSGFKKAKTAWQIFNA